MNIRHLTQADLPMLLALYEHLHFADSPLPAPQEVSAVWESIQRNEGIRYWGVFVESVLVSSCTITVIPNLTRGCHPYGMIENVVTHAAYRKRGYGSAVLKSALTYAWSVGCYKVMLLTGRKDDAVYRFYQSAGFDPHSKQAFVAKPGHSSMGVKDGDEVTSYN
jgi:GNAT superfamily N-acetyltransferase